MLLAGQICAQQKADRTNTLEELRRVQQLLDTFKAQGWVREDPATGHVTSQADLPDVAGLVAETNRLRDLIFPEMDTNAPRAAAAYGQSMVDRDKARWKKKCEAATVEVRDLGTGADPLIRALAAEFLQKKEGVNGSSASVSQYGTQDGIEYLVTAGKNAVLIRVCPGTASSPVPARGHLICGLEYPQGSVVARQCYAVIAHPDERTESLTLQDLAKWVRAGAGNAERSLAPLPEGDAARLIARRLGLNTLPANAVSGTTAQKLEQEVLGRRGMLALVPFPQAFYTHARVLRLRVDGAADAHGTRPSPLSAVDKIPYPLTFKVCLAKEGQPGADAIEFLEFCESQKAGDIVLRHGYGKPD